MSLSQSEILVNLDLVGMAPVRIPTALRERDYSDEQYISVFRLFAGEDASLPAYHLIPVVVTYLAHDAASGRPLDVANCIARAQRVADILPGNFSEAAARERAELREKSGKKPEPKPVVLNEDGTPVARKRGRAPSGGESVYDKVKAAYLAAADKSKGAMLPMLQETLGIGAGTAQTYWYKAKKELATA
jgi:hypothetical protein